MKRVTLHEPVRRDETSVIGMVNELLPDFVRLPSASGRSCPPSDKNPRGERFGEYELIKPLGRGGMGAVFKARHVGLNRLVALKLIHQGPHPEEVVRKRFLREAEAVARLKHPHIVVLYEAGEEAGKLFLVMEYVAGKTLAEVFAEGPLPSRQAAAHLKKVAEAIHYAHEHGVLHRDLKPSNIALDLDLEPRVMDFGLARLMEQDSEMTVSGMALGTPSYMPPEQAAGKMRDVHATGDVYSMGAVLYEALTGRPPFQAESPLEVMHQVLQHDPISPRLLNPTIPRDLETICLKCLAKEPRRRYATAESLAADLDRFLRDEPIHALPATFAENAWRWCRRNRALALALGLVLALFLVVGIGSPIAVFQINQERHAAYAHAASEQKQRQRAEDAIIQSRQRLYAARINLAHQAFEEGDAARVEELLNSLRPQPDGEDLRGFEWYYLRQLCHDELFSLTNHFGFVRTVAFSPDGRTLAFAGDDEIIRLCDGATGQLRAQCQGHSNIISAVAFSPDGKALASVSADGTARLWDSANGDPLGVLWTETNSLSTVAFSADGKYLAAGTAKLGNGKSSPRTRYTPPWDQPASHITLWNFNEAKMARRFDAHADGVYTLAFSSDGKTLTSGGKDGAICSWDLVNHKSSTIISNSDEPVFGVSFSADGRHLAATAWAPTFADANLQIFDTATHQRLAQLDYPGPATCLAYSPDGTMLATAGTDELFRVWDLPNVRLRTKLTRHTGVISSLAWSPDSKRLATGSWDGSVRVWDMNRSAEADVFPTPANFSLAFSPDGKVLAAGGGGVELWNTATGKRFKTFSEIKTSDVRVAFSPDGNLLAACDADDVIHLFTTTDWNSLGTFPVPDHRITAMVISPDSKTLAAATMDKTVRLFDVHSHRERLCLTSNDDYIVTLAFTPDGKSLITGGRPMKFWDPITGKQQRSKNESAVRVAVSPDGKKLAAALSDYSIVLFDFSTMNEEYRLKGHKDEIFGLTFSPDGKTLATASWDSTVKLWHVSSGEPLMTFKSPLGVSWCAAFSPDNSMLAFGSGRSDGGEITMLHAQVDPRRQNGTPQYSPGPEQ